MPKKAKESEAEREAQGLAKMLAPVILFATRFPKISAVLAAGGLVSATGAGSTFFANWTNAKSREAKIDSAIAIVGFMYHEIKEIRKNQSPDHDTLRVLNGACNEQSGCVTAKKVYRRKVREAQRYIGMGPVRSATDHTNYVLQNQPQPRRIP